MTKKKESEYKIWGLDDARVNASIIEQTLEAFGYKTKVVEVNALKSYIQYCIEIERGISVEDIMNKKVDLALALASPTGKVKIIAPVPNSSYIGINLPKRKISKDNEFNIVTANGKNLKIRNLDLLTQEFSKKRISELTDEAIKFLFKYKFETVGTILFERELKIKPKESVVIFKELFNLEVIKNVRSEEDKPGVIIGDIDWDSLKKYAIN